VLSGLPGKAKGLYPFQREFIDLFYKIYDTLQVLEEGFAFFSLQPKPG
jgi:hypothetical protein